MKWKILPQKSNDLIEQLLINRGIKTSSDKVEFFHSKLEDFEKNFKIPEIPKAVKRIQKAIELQELIIVYGDYDVDGICGAAVLYLGLTKLGAKVLPYIPHREKEGYGLSKVGMEFSRDSGAAVVISVDCGIVSFEAADFAKEIGLDLIITDHHQLDGKKRPVSLAIVHETNLCGTAVAWCLVRSLSEDGAEELVDLVAVATIADMMPLVGVNRVLVKKGIEKLNRTKRVGWIELFNEAGIAQGNIGSYEIGHIIAPRLNAMGRLEHAIDSLRLLCTKDPKKARDLANLISETNNQRKKLTQDAVEGARLKVVDGKKIHILSDNWNPGIIGLVAGRICEETKCPVIAISIGEIHSKGSARSIDGVNIVELLRECRDILVAVGGHPGAAGFTIATENIEIFKSRLEELTSEGIRADEFSLEIEAEVPIKKLSLELVRKLEEFEPFGMANQKPVLASSGMRLLDIRTVGLGKHLKFKAEGIDAIFFGRGEMKNILQVGQLVNLAFNLEIDKYNGFEKLQLKIKDIQND